MPFAPLQTVPVQLLPDGRLRTLEPFTWTGTRGDTVTVPAGTVTDLASVPWWLRGVIAHDGRIARAAIVHDVLCDELRAYRAARLKRWHADPDVTWKDTATLYPAPAFSAVDADGVFRLILAELGVHPVRRAIYWEGVRAGAAGSPWRRAGWWRTLPAFLACLPLVLLVLPGALGALLSGLLLAAAGVLVAPFDRDRLHRNGAEELGRLASPLRRPRRTLELGRLVPDDVVPTAEVTGREILAGTLRTSTTGRRLETPRAPGDRQGRAVYGCRCPDWRTECGPHYGACPLGRAPNDEASSDPGARPALTGSALDRAVGDYFGDDPADVHELRAFRAGWRMSQDVAAAGAARARAAAAAARADGLAAAGPLGRPLEAHGPDGCACGAWRDDLAPHSVICPASPRRRPAGPARAGRWLAALPRRAARAAWRALCALGRGLAAVLSALFDEL